MLNHCQQHFLFPPNRYGFLIDVKKVLEHLIEDNCNWPSVNLIISCRSKWYTGTTGVLAGHIAGKK